MKLRNYGLLYPALLLVLAQPLLQVSASLRKSRQEMKTRSLHEKVQLQLPKSLAHFQSNSNRIVGGEHVTSPGVYPFYVSWDGSCGGSLIHPDIVLTAAHCGTISSDSVTVNAFKLDDSTTDGAEVRSVVERSRHPDYNSFTFANDFLLLKLNSSVTSVHPIQLNEIASVPSPGQNLTVIGLGTTSEGGFQSELLQKVTVQAISDGECNEKYGGEIVEDVMFCAGVEGGGKDSCQGDSGGPIFTVTESGDVDKQVGVVSWGFGCAQSEFPGVYAELSSATVSGWLFNEICRLSEEKPAGCPEPTPAPTPTPPSEDEARVYVEVRTDQYPQEVSWSLFDDSGSIVASAAEGTYDIQNQLFAESLNLKKGTEYTFTIEDSSGDGLCCSFGDGMWLVRTGDIVLASGATYGSSDTEKFVVPHEDPIEWLTPSPTPSGAEYPTLLPTPIGTESPTPFPTIPSGPRECDDTTGTVFVDSVAGDQSCDWLNTNLDRYSYLCQFVDVATTCPATCDWCSLFG